MLGVVLGLSLALAGCAAGGAADEGGTTDTTSGLPATPPAPTGPGASGEPSTEGPGDGDRADEGPATEEPGGSPRVEGRDDVEPPAAGGDGRVAIELAGLPVGGGQTFDVDGTWCQVLFWGSALGPGVGFSVTSIAIGDPGGTLRDFGCEGAPPCVGATIDADHGGCAVAVTPTDPTVDLVRVRLAGVLRCPDQATCDALVPARESWAAITPPPGWGSTESDDGTGGPGDGGGSGDGTSGTEEEGGGGTEEEGGDDGDGDGADGGGPGAGTDGEAPGSAGSPGQDG